MSVAGQLGSELARARSLITRAATDPTTRGEVPRKLRREVAIRWSTARRPRDRVSVPRVDLPAGPVNQPQVTAGVILDDFSELALRYEWNHLAVTPDGWRSQLESADVDLLFVESAWNGNGGAWRLAMTGEGSPSPELRSLVEWCRVQGVPTVFWNKEDPPNYDRFIETARLFDHVFTVDADRLDDYRRDLGHDRVALLPFGAQPRIHNPIRRGAGRTRDVAFAGSYFAEKHDVRREQMGWVLAPALDYGLDIFSRLAGGDGRYRFPRRYAGAVVGSLPYERMLGAYTAYRVFLNVNSVTASPTMCARRLFELSAAQTPVLSGPAASIESFFGDCVRVSHDADETERELRALLQHEEYRDRIGLLAHRRVFDEHLYEHRVATVLDAVGVERVARTRSISAIVPTMRPHRLDHVLELIGAQTHPDVELVVVAHGFEPDEAALRRRARELGVEHLVLVRAAPDLSLGACMNLGVEAASGRYVAKMDDDNLYAAHYLSDLVRAFDYTGASVVGKWAHYAHLTSTGATLLRFPEAEHRYVDLVQGGTLLLERDLAATLRFEDLPRRVATTFLEMVRRDGGRVYSADRFGFVSVRASTPDRHTWPISDLDLLARRGRIVFYGDPTAHVTVV